MNLITGLPELTGLLLWGFVATVVMTVILYGSQAAGFSRMSLPFVVGTCLTADRDRAHVLGFAVYLLGGWAFAFLYAVIFVVVGADWWTGLLVGIVHGLFLLLVLLPLMPHVHPRMASVYDGPSEIRRLQPPGFMGLNYGYRTPFTTLLAQAAYGLILGASLNV